MALVPSSAIAEPLIAEVVMAGSPDSSSIVVRAAVVQASTVFYDTPATLDKAERLIAEAAELGSQFVVFPEAFIGGYPLGSNFGVTIGSRSAKGKEDFRKYHASAIDVPGIEIYCAPTADAREIWQASMTHIALEGGCFVLSANQFCRRKDYPPPPEYVFAGEAGEPSPDSVVCAGGSVIISPSGVVLAGPAFEGEAIISADLDLGEIVKAKFDFDVVGHYSRPEVLNLIVKDHPHTPVSFTSSLGDESRRK